MFEQQDEPNPYLVQDVLSSDQFRLRWLLIRRAEELCVTVQNLWEAGDNPHGDQWMLRVQEILGELLGGVTDASNPVSSAVSDFYVFLIQLAVEVAQSRDIDRLTTLQELLAIENETWRLVMEKNSTATASEENQSAVFVDSPAKPPPPPVLPFDMLPGDGAFNLEI